MTSISKMASASNNALLTVTDTIQEHLSKWAHLELVSMLTLILVLFHGFVTDNYRYPVQLFFLVAVFYRPILSSALA